MTTPPASDGPATDPIADLIRRVNDGEPGAQDLLFDAAYADLRKLARARLRDGGRDTTMDTTALVHESYLRFLHGGTLRSETRAAFFAYASKVMRSVIVDAVRARQSERRGGDLERMTLSTQAADDLPNGEDEILRVHEALESLARVDERLARVVEMKYFGGMSELEIAGTLGITDRTVRRDWEKARVLLTAMLAE